MEAVQDAPAHDPAYYGDQVARRDVHWPPPVANFGDTVQHEHLNGAVVLSSIMTPVTIWTHSQNFWV